MARPVALVTGSSSGIGAAIVKRFAREGYDVVIHYNSGAERAAAIADAIRREHAVAAIAIGADIGQLNDPFRLVDEAYDHFGRLDVMVSNSGVANYVRDERGELIRYAFQDAPPEHLEREFELVFNINIKGSYRVTQRAFQHMLTQARQEQAQGETPAHRSIIMISSINDVAPDITRIPYGLSKAGLNHVVIGVALEGGPHNITINAVRPGVVDTPMTARPSGISDPKTGREYSVAETYQIAARGGLQALPRTGRPEDIAAAAYYFTQIPYMTGQLIAVDGGFTLANGFVQKPLFMDRGLDAEDAELKS